MNSESNTKIEDLGYNAFFESNRKKLKLDNFSIARVRTHMSRAVKLLRL